MFQRSVVEIQFVGVKRKPPKIVTTQEAMNVEQRLRSRLRHPRSKILDSKEIMRVEEKILNRRLARSVMGS